MATYSAVLDSCVMVPVAICDIHLRLAERMLFRPLWSARILADARDAVLRVHPEIAREGVERRFRQMNEAFPTQKCAGTKYSSRDSNCPIPTIATCSQRRSPPAQMRSSLPTFATSRPDLWDRFGIEIISPDDFLLNQLDMASRVVIGCVEEQAAATKHPPLSVDDLLGAFTRSGASRFADEVALRL